MPQKMLRLRHSPAISESADGLTADSGQAYRRVGIAWMLLGVGITVAGLFYL